MSLRRILVCSALAAALAPSGARADSATDKKQRALAAKAEAAAAARPPARLPRYHRELDRRIGRPPPPVVDVYHGWTHEHLAVAADYRRHPVPQAVIDRFLRCRFTNQTTAIDRRLFPALVGAANHFHVDRVVIISGHRSPKYNLLLHKKGREVSNDSRHVVGTAIDFRLPGVPTDALRAWALGLGLGGVGFYPESGFVHIDTGPVRQWSGQ